MIRTYLVTPSLFVGEIPLCGGVRCVTAPGALQVIRSGETAVLPHAHWATARDVLRALGVGEDEARDRCRYAQTARL